MRIGALVGIVGITTRAVRHCHRIGLLPERPRHPIGYREYALRDAVEPARIRRRAELGLSLDEAKDVLSTTWAGTLSNSRRAGRRPDPPGGGRSAALRPKPHAAWRKEAPWHCQN
ncbi:MerR family transcriptional regulator [Streptomyces decoyicus]|uniref:MerR family transcriptional regulator n=1 Tax=Streptomyces decoyicus TaxID=249567 RepID=UPI0036267A47